MLRSALSVIVRARAAKIEVGCAMIRRVVLLAVAAILLTACGNDNGSGASTVPSSAVAGATPNAASLVNCPPTGQGPTGGSLTGLGASIGAFEQAHGPRDQQYDAEFGRVWPGPTNKGLHEFSPRCTQAGYVGSVQRYLGSPLTAAQVKAGIQRDGIAPLDATQIDDKTQGQCELVIYHSPSLASVAGLGDPAGNFVLELGSSTANGGAYNAADVEDLIYDYDVNGGC